MILTTLSHSSLICFCVSIYLLLTPSSLFFYFSYCILQLCLIFFIFSNSLLNFLMCSSILLHLLSIFMIITLNPFSDCLFPHPLVLFLRFCLVPSFGTYSSVSSFYLILCAYFYMLDTFYTFLDLVDVALCRRYAVGSSHRHLCGHQS